jgi:sugar lactone lactonase YvrE
MRSLGDVLTGPPEALRLYGPRALLCTAGGQRVWIADLGGRCLYVFDLAERSCRRLRQFGDQPLMAPVDVCLGPGGTIYLCDAQQAAVHQIMENTGDWIATLRLPEDIERPVAITYREAKDELYVVDVKAHDIKVLTSDGSLLRLLGGRGASPGTFNFPSDVVDDGQSLWVVDTGNHRVQRLGYDGAPLLIIGQEGDAPGDLAMPKSVALDSEGHAYVVDARFENVQLFDQQGRLLLFFGEEGIGPGQFWLPAGVFIDSRDRIWVCDSYNARVQVFQYLKPQAASDDAVRDEPRIR